MNRFFLVAGAALTLILAAGPAAATSITVFDDLPDSVDHGESVKLASPEGASFTSANVISAIQSLTLALDCDLSTSTECGVGSYSNAQTVSASVVNTNVITLNSVSGITVGSFIDGDGIAPGTVYVTAINGNTLTLSQNVTITGGSGHTVSFLPQGSFTVSLYATSNPSNIPGSSLTSSSVPTGSALASFTVFDAFLYTTNPLIDGGTSCASGSCQKADVDFTWLLPFGNLELNPDTTYWIDLTGTGAPGDPTATNVEWEFLNGNAGTGVSGEYWNVALYNASCISKGASTNPCSYLNGGSADIVGPASFGMEITEVPEPSTLALFGAALLGFGYLRRRRDKAAG